MVNTDTTAYTVRQRRKGVDERGVGPGNVEAGPKDDENLDLDMALSKIEGLTGMIRAQEEIEMLLGRELKEFKSKQAGTSESVWRLQTRYDVILKKSRSDCPVTHVTMSTP